MEGGMPNTLWDFADPIGLGNIELSKTAAFDPVISKIEVIHFKILTKAIVGLLNKCATVLHNLSIIFVVEY